MEVRYNVIKSLILSDCDHLIKFILFGDEETVENKNSSGLDEKEGKKKMKKRKDKKKMISDIYQVIYYGQEKNF